MDALHLSVPEPSDKSRSLRDSGPGRNDSGPGNGITGRNDFFPETSGLPFCTVHRELCLDVLVRSWSTFAMPRITLYSKPGCHLCDRAKEVIERCRLQYEVVDISGNADLEARYGRDIPVVLLDGVEIARHFVRERKLLELLSKT